MLQIGCTARDIIDAVNALIAAHNDGESGNMVSYNDLADKPSINGVELSGNKNTSALLIALAGCVDYNTLMDTLATKAYSDEHDAAMVAAAHAAAQAVLDSKLDKDLSNIETIDTFPGDAKVLVFTPNGIRLTTFNNVAAYTEIRAATLRTEFSSAVKEQLKILPLAGDQDGRNTTFACEVGYTLSTSCLYLNGQLLTKGKDYTETSSYQIVMLTHIPVATDVLVFMAVPLA